MTDETSWRWCWGWGSLRRRGEKERGRSFRRRRLPSTPTNMPAGWWADAAKWKKGGLFIGETNPDVNCASCHGKDASRSRLVPVTHVGERTAYPIQWAWRVSEGAPIQR
jgi:hypothetical protein